MEVAMQSFSGINFPSSARTSHCVSVFRGLRFLQEEEDIAEFSIVVEILAIVESTIGWTTRPGGPPATNSSSPRV